MTDHKDDSASQALRKQFEAWFRDIFMSGMDDAGEFDEERNCYVTFQVHMAHQGFMAGRKQMAEEAAAVCLANLIPNADDRGGEDYAYNGACEECAESIRSLATPREPSA